MSKQMIVQTRALLNQSKEQIKLALPKHLDVDRVMRTAMTEVNKNTYLQKCNPLSVVGSVIQASELGLEVGSALGHAFLVPYGDKAQLIVGYKGLLSLARRSGNIKTITARAVYENDEFEYRYGLADEIKHKPALNDPGPMVAVYAIALFKDGGHQFEVMSVEEVEKIRKRSKAGNSGPWKTDPEEMSRKTVIRRLFKYLPMSVEDNQVLKAVGLDEEADRGEQNNSALVVDQEGAPREETAAERLKKIAKKTAEKEVPSYEDSPVAMDFKDAPDA
jgi:recombination protein RecT